MNTGKIVKSRITFRNFHFQSLRVHEFKTEVRFINVVVVKINYQPRKVFSWLVTKVVTKVKNSRNFSRWHKRLKVPCTKSESPSEHCFERDDTPVDVCPVFSKDVGWYFREWRPSSTCPSPWRTEHLHRPRKWRRVQIQNIVYEG